MGTGLEDSGKCDYAPSEYLGRKYCGKRMYDKRRVHEHGEQSSARISKEVTYYVDDDYACSGKFDTESFLYTDEERHCHGKAGEQQLIFDPGHTASQCDSRM